MADIIIIAVVVGIVGFTVFRYLKNRKNGGTACNCGSAGSTCGKADSCGMINR